MSEAMLEFHLDHFEGPMDLLIHLLEKNSIDIYDIPIETITDQYLLYLEEAESMNLEIASSFLLMAANLIRIKVKTLLPRRNEAAEEEDPKAILMNQLLEYRFFKSVAEELRVLEQNEWSKFTRLHNMDALSLEYRRDEPLSGLSVEALQKAFQVILAEAEDEPLLIHVPKSEINVAEQVAAIVKRCKEEGGLSFSALFEHCRFRLMVISCFLALLECIHAGHVEVVQKKMFSDIWIYPYEKEAS